MKMKQTLSISVKDAEEQEHLMDQWHDDPFHTDCADGEKTFDVEVVFDDKRRFAIQVIACREESAWSQGVLFEENGQEIACTEVYGKFLGEYTIKIDNTEYTVDLVTK